MTFASLLWVWHAFDAQFWSRLIWSSIFTVWRLPIVTFGHCTLSHRFYLLIFCLLSLQQFPTQFIYYTGSCEGSYYALTLPKGCCFVMGVHFIKKNEHPISLLREQCQRFRVPVWFDAGDLTPNYNCAEFGAVPKYMTCFHFSSLFPSINCISSWTYDNL